MSEYKVITLPLAEEDIAAHTDYIAYELGNPDAAMSMVSGFRKIINNLSIYPKSHELDKDKELKKYNIRKVYFKKYKIYFLIDELNRIVYILRVFHMLEDSRDKILKLFSS